MSLFGAMTSGVSGLAAQSSAMGAIADNITNVSTVGYKGTNVDFQTLVTKQASSSQYASGGVQSRPRGGVDIQGLLQSSANTTNLAISGSGFFLVNEASEPGTGDQFLMSRAGSFYPDSQGFLRNTAGYFLQAWPTDASGNVVLPRSSGAALTNENIISTDFLETVNLNRVSGTSAETSQISLGAILPASDEVGTSHNIDVQFFDVIGNTNAVTFNFSKAGANTWDLSVDPPTGVAVIDLRDAAGQIYRSTGQLEFTDQPVAGAQLTVNGTTYTFVDPPTVPGPAEILVGSNLGATVANIVTRIGGQADFSGASGHHEVAVKAGSSTTILFTGGDRGGLADFTIDVAQLNTAAGKPATRQGNIPTQTFDVELKESSAPAIQFSGTGLPAAFGVAEMGVSGFASGAADMDNTDVDGDLEPDVARIALNLGTLNESGGISQTGTEFSPTFIEQNGARFGLFTGVNVDNNGLVSALFDNGEQRPIYRIPLVTFVNPNGLEAESGNAWSATQQSGTATLRQAGSGSAGNIIQSSLESSTVDIGEEFTRMIVVQRAYSAATRIISAADEMLDELVRIKR